MTTYKKMEDKKSFHDKLLSKLADILKVHESQLYLSLNMEEDEIVFRFKKFYKFYIVPNDINICRSIYAESDFREDKEYKEREKSFEKCLNLLYNFLRLYSTYMVTPYSLRWIITTDIMHGYKESVEYIMQFLENNFENNSRKAYIYNTIKEVLKDFENKDFRRSCFISDEVLAKWEKVNLVKRRIK